MSRSKYPRIPHLASSRSEAGDLVLSEAASRSFLGPGATVFEKLDGLNVGFSFRSPGRLRIHSRVHGLLAPGDVGDALWPLTSWATRVQARLYGVCGSRWGAFGEFLHFQLGVRYRALPDLVIFFDLIDLKTGRAARDGRTRLADAGFVVNEPIGRARSLAELKRLRGRRPHGADRDEGLLLERAGERAKLVWPDYEALPSRLVGARLNGLSATSARTPCPR